MTAKEAREIRNANIALTDYHDICKIIKTQAQLGKAECVYYSDKFPATEALMQLKLDGFVIEQPIFDSREFNYSTIIKW